MFTSVQQDRPARSVCASLGGGDTARHRRSDRIAGEIASRASTWAIDDSHLLMVSAILPGESAMTTRAIRRECGSCIWDLRPLDGPHVPATTSSARAPDNASRPADPGEDAWRVVAGTRLWGIPSFSAHNMNVLGESKLCVG